MSFTMNWKIMDPDQPVRFELGEPLFQAIPLVSNVCADLEDASVSYQKLSDNPELLRAYQEWDQGRRRFHEQKAAGDVKPDDWQKDYFQGRDAIGQRGDLASHDQSEAAPGAGSVRHRRTPRKTRARLPRVDTRQIARRARPATSWSRDPTPVSRASTNPDEPDRANDPVPGLPGYHHDASQPRTRNRNRTRTSPRRTLSDEPCARRLPTSHRHPGPKRPARGTSTTNGAAGSPRT